MKKVLLTIVTGLLLMCGMIYAEDSTQTETGITQSPSPVETDMMRFVRTLPPQLNGNILRSIAEGLANDGYTEEAIVCYKMGIVRIVAHQKPQDKQKAMDMSLHSFMNSQVFTLASKEQREEMKRYAFANVSAGYRKYIEQVTRNR